LSLIGAASMRAQFSQCLCDAAHGDVRVLDRCIPQIATALGEEIDAQVHCGERAIDVVTRHSHVVLELLARFVVPLELREIHCALPRTDLRTDPVCELSSEGSRPIPSANA
jgi:hypothetical protein